MFYPLLCTLLAVKTYDCGQDVCFYHKMNCKAADKTLEQRFLKELKAACKNPGESELKEQKVKCDIIWVGYALSPSIIILFYI